MFDAFKPETPFWEIALRGTVVYLALWLVLRLIPKRHTGNLSPNDFITLIVVGGLAADAIVGQAKVIPDILLMAIVVLFWTISSIWPNITCRVSVTSRKTLRRF